MKIPVEWFCPFCGRGGVASVTQEAETRYVQTTGLVFPRGEGRVLVGMKITVEHEIRGGALVERYVCSGAPPAGYVPP